jgi:hypothetical protein
MAPEVLQQKGTRNQIQNSFGILKTPVEYHRFALVGRTVSTQKRSHPIPVISVYAIHGSVSTLHLRNKDLKRVLHVYKLCHAFFPILAKCREYKWKLGRESFIIFEKSVFDWLRANFCSAGLDFGQIPADKGSGCNDGLPLWGLQGTGGLWTGGRLACCCLR